MKYLRFSVTVGLTLILSQSALPQPPSQKGKRQLRMSPVRKNPTRSLKPSAFKKSDRPKPERSALFQTRFTRAQKR